MLSNAGTSRPSGTPISIRARRDVREEVDSVKVHIGIALCRTCAPFAPDPLHHLSSPERVPHPFRERLLFIVIAVMSVTRGTFPHINRVFYMTVNRWCIWGPSLHRHGYCHRRNTLPKRFPRRRDGDDARDGHLRAFSYGGFPATGKGWLQPARISALRRSGTPARLPQTLRPTSSFGHPLDQAQSGPRVPKSRVVAARELLVLV